MTRARRRLHAAIALAGLCAFAAIAPAAWASPAPFSLKKGVRVNSSGVTSLTLTCPKNTTALSGAVVASSDGVSVRDSLPRDSHRWVFRFTSQAGAAAPRARAEVRCLRLEPAAGVRNWKVGNFTGSRSLRIGGLSSRRLRVRCTSGYLATGYGIVSSGADPTAPLPSGEILVAKAIPAHSSFLFQLENTGADPRRVSAHVRCLGRTASAKRNGGSVRQGFAVTHTRFTDRVQRGARRNVRHSCAAGHYSLAAGVSLSARDDIFLSGAHPDARRSAAWRFNHPSGPPQRLRTYLTCLSLRTGFR